MKKVKIDWVSVVCPSNCFGVREGKEIEEKQGDDFNGFLWKTALGF